MNDNLLARHYRMAGIAHNLIEAGKEAFLALYLDGHSEYEAALHERNAMDRLAAIADHLGCALVDKAGVAEGQVQP